MKVSDENLKKKFRRKSQMKVSDVNFRRKFQTKVSDKNLRRKSQAKIPDKNFRRKVQKKSQTENLKQFKCVICDKAGFATKQHMLGVKI